MNNQSSKKPLVLIKNLCKNFEEGESKLEVLKDINLELNREEIVTIIGESGVGKSTLLHILGTLDHPTSGTILFEGENVFELKEHDLAAFRNKTIGFIFQFHHLLIDFTALENVMIPLLIGGIDKKAAKEKSMALIEEVGLGERAYHKPGEMSGGEQQRIAIARSLINEPQLILADEPTGNLDTANGDAIFNLLKKLNSERKVTFVLVTHSQRLVGKSDRTIEIMNGKIVV